MKNIFTFSLSIVTVLICSAQVQLPQVYVNTCAPTAIITKTVCSSGCDYTNNQLQQAIDNAVYGTEIVLEAGATYTGNFDLPVKTGTGWIIIRSSQMTQLPNEDNRVTPTDETVMPKIQTNNTTAVFTAPSKSHHYRLMGLNITITSTALGDANQGGNSHSGFLRLGDFYETNVNDQAHDIVLDRCYIHGDPKSNNRRGVWFDVINGAVINSYISDFHDVGADAQSILIANNPGPVKIVNNYLEASGENILVGGIDVPIQNLIPSDIEIKGNHFNHPLTWKQGHASYAGYPWVIKNLFELKYGRRVLVEKNVFENNWEAAQSGMALNIKSSNQDGNMPWSVTEHITIQNNLIRHCNTGIVMNECDCYIHPALALNNVKIYNNVFDDLDYNTWGGSGSGHFMMVLGAVQNITVDHNTCVKNGNVIIVDATSPNYASNFVFTNNIVESPLYGIKGTGTGSGSSTINMFFPGSTFTKNVIVDQYTGSGYPSNNFYPATTSAVDFVNYNNGNGGDYHLKSTSLYKNAGSDGKDCGADIDAVNLAITSTLSGYYASCETTTSIAIEQQQNSFTVYPNPSAGCTTIILSDDFDLQGASLTISDISGKLIHEIKTVTDRKIMLSENMTNPGIYFITLKHLNERKGGVKWIKH